MKMHCAPVWLKYWHTNALVCGVWVMVKNPVKGNLFFVVLFRHPKRESVSREIR